MRSAFWFVGVLIALGSGADRRVARRPRTLGSVLDWIPKVPPHATKVPFWLHTEATFACESPGFFADKVKCEQFYQCASMLAGHLVRYVYECDDDRVYSIKFEACVKAEDSERPECSQNTNEQSQLETQAQPQLLLPPLDLPQPQPQPLLQLQPQPERKTPRTPPLQPSNRPADGPNFAEQTSAKQANESESIEHSTESYQINLEEQIEQEEAYPTDEQVESEDVASPCATDSEEACDISISGNFAYPEGSIENDTATGEILATESATLLEGSATENIPTTSRIATEQHAQDLSDFFVAEENENTESTTIPISASSDVHEDEDDEHEGEDDEHEDEDEDEDEDAQQTCIEEGFFANSRDCSKFYRCVAVGFAFVKYEFSCPYGTIWDDRVKTCNFLANVDLSSTCELDSGILALPPFEHRSNATAGDLPQHRFTIVCPTGFRRYSKYCNVFYQCTVNDSLGIDFKPFACPEGTIFDEEKVACASNQTITRHAGECVNFELHGTLNAIKILDLADEELCSEEGEFPYGGSCSNEYFKCAREGRGALEGYLMHCSAGQIYSSLSTGCVPLTSFPSCVHRDQTTKL